MAKPTNNEKKLNNSKLTEIMRSMGKVLYRAVVDDSVEREDLVKPVFYSLVGDRFKQSGFLPEIEIVNESQSFYFKGVILDQGPTHAVVKEILFVDFNATDGILATPDQDLGYKVVKQGYTWSVIAPDGKTVKEGIKSKSEAQRELEEHLTVLKL